MTAPDVSLERQKRRHRTMVKGIWWGVAIAVLVAVIFWIMMASPGSDSASAALLGTLATG